MRSAPLKFLLAIGFFISGLSLSLAEDEKKPDDQPPDWSEYAKGPMVNGEVSKLEKGDWVTIKIPKRSTRGRVSYDELKFEYAEQGLLRWSQIPPKVDENGKKVILSFKERQDLKTPKGVPGYKAEKDELQVGHIVQLELVRPKEIPAAKATPQDFKIKYATIVGFNPGPGGK
jgi:hypothetical protein